MCDHDQTIIIIELTGERHVLPRPRIMQNNAHGRAYTFKVF